MEDLGCSLTRSLFQIRVATFASSFQVSNDFLGSTPLNPVLVYSSLVAECLKINLWYQVVRVQVSGPPLTITLGKLCNPSRAQYLVHQKKGSNISSYIVRLLCLLKE